MVWTVSPSWVLRAHIADSDHVAQVRASYGVIGILLKFWEQIWVGRGKGLMYPVVDLLTYFIEIGKHFAFINSKMRDIVQ